MTKGKILDIAHISFLDMIKSIITLSGSATAKGILIRNALATAERTEEVEYSSFEEYLEAIEDSTNPITRVEGKANHCGNMVFGLEKCPFETSITNYKEVFKEMPEGYANFTAEFNKSSPITNKYRVGEGAGVSPFCSVHQPLRSALGGRIKIGGQKVAITQLGCKSATGVKGIAPKWLSEAGVGLDKVDEILENNMCCYHLRIEAE